jgi:hypothetical protein
LSERSDAGNSIVQEVFAFVKRNLSGAQRRGTAASEERGAGKGRHVLSRSVHRDPASVSSTATVTIVGAMVKDKVATLLKANGYVEKDGNLVKEISVQ